MPSSVVENPLFKDMVSALRPPSRDTLSNKLLDTTHDKLQVHTKARLNNKTMTMQQDGWSTVQNDPVIATCVTSQGKGYFVDAKDTGTAHKTAENCKTMPLDSESTAEQMYGCKVRTIVTDNAKNVEKMRKEMEKEDSNLVTYSNLSHVLNLLGQDLTPASVVKHVTEVNKFFINHHVPTAWLKDQLGATRPHLPNDTRWKGQLICLDSFLTNRMHYIKFIHDHPDETEGTMTQKVNDINLFRQVSDLAKMLRPVAIALDKGQDDNATIADACEIFLNLLNEPPGHGAEEI